MAYASARHRLLAYKIEGGVFRESNAADGSASARAAAAAALLYGGASTPSSTMMVPDRAESAADCVTAALRHQLLAATAVLAARTPGYVVPSTPSAPVQHLPIFPTAATTGVDRHAAADCGDFDAARLKQHLDAGKHCRKITRGINRHSPERRDPRRQ